MAAARPSVANWAVTVRDVEALGQEDEERRAMLLAHYTRALAFAVSTKEFGILSSVLDKHFLRLEGSFSRLLWVLEGWSCK